MSSDQSPPPKAKLSDIPWQTIATQMRAAALGKVKQLRALARSLLVRVLPEDWCAILLGPEAEPGAPLEGAGGDIVPAQQAWAISEAEREELYYATDAQAALYDAPTQRSTRFVLAMLGVLVVFIGWAYFAELEEVTRGDGRVIPSSKTQIIQSLEGGIVKELLVKEGQKVTKDQVLLRIDDTGFSSNLGELNAKELSLKAQIARLRAESSIGIDGVRIAKIEFPTLLIERAPQVVENERGLFQIRRTNLANQINVLADRLEQRKQALEKLRADEFGFGRSLEIATQRYDRFAEAERKGALSVTRVLEIEQQKADLERQLVATQKSIAGAESAVKEARRLAEEQVLSFRQTAHTELNTKLSELAVVEQSLKAANDRVDRADVRSPVSGMVNKLHVNTVGGVVRAGEPMIEITPLEEKLYVEVRIQPKDIAFLSPGLPALVKVSAYDFTIYGGLDGTVDVISSDSIVDQATKESYYLITVKTYSSSLRKGNESLPIIPGMVATVDIITGKKSVLDYILKPIVKARQEAMRER